MNARVGNVYFDTCTLSNFAVVGRLQVLETRYGYRARWTETVAHEIRLGRSVEPTLQRVLDSGWLGEPVEIDGDRNALREIDNIRRGLGGTATDPLKHLGEAEIIYHLGRREPSGIFITDDRPALDFARNRNIFVLDTSQILAECFSLGELGCPEAYELLQEMYIRNRGVRVPANHMSVCPS